MSAAVNDKGRKTSGAKKKTGSTPQKNGLPPGATTPGVANGLLTCPVCKKPYRSPKLLRCLHSFCEPCLRSSLEAMRLGPDQTFLCPICRTQCHLPKRGTASLPDNPLLETLGELTAKKAVPQIPRCQGCEETPPAEATMKCVECDDWLCATCVDMHRRVKVSRTHHLVSPDVLDAGEADNLIKANFSPVVCSKHGEPMKLFCMEPGCGLPICSVCKSTLGHDGHRAIEVEEKAKLDAQAMQGLLPAVMRHSTALRQKMTNIQEDDKMTTAFKKQMHKDINARVNEVVEQLVKLVGEYAETLHEDVERLAKEHKDDLVTELDNVKHQLQGTMCAQTLAAGLLENGRVHEMVRLASTVNARLDALKRIPDSKPPAWRRPRLHPTDIPSENHIAQIVGELTFEGHLIKSVLIRSFSAKLEGDARNCSLSDVCVTVDNDVIVVDKDNKKVKVFSVTGQCLFATDADEFKAPIRATVLKDSGDVIVKDDKILKIMQTDGTVTGQFASKVRHPIAMSQNRHGEILVADWNSSNIHCLNPSGEELYNFNSNLEAPAYVASNLRDHIIVSDWKQNIVRVYERGGRFLWQYGREDGQQLDHPYGVCADKYCHLLVTDSWHHRIHLVSEEGRLLRLVLGKDNGIHYPQAVATTMDGLLVVAEAAGMIKVFQYLA